MPIYLVYERQKGYGVTYQPWSSTGFIPLARSIACGVEATSPRDAAEKLGLGHRYVEEVYDRTGDHRWQGFSSHTIHIGRNLFERVTEADEVFGPLVEIYGEGRKIFKFEQGPILVSITDENVLGVVLEIEELRMADIPVIGSLESALA